MVITALQARLEGLRAAGLLTEAELFALEDAAADFLELRASVATNHGRCCHLKAPHYISFVFLHTNIMRGT